MNSEPNFMKLKFLIFRQLVFVFTVLLLSSHLSVCQNEFSNNVDSAKIHTEDINLFWQVFDETNPKFDANIFDEKYLNAGSDGLKGFIKMRIENGKNLSKTIKNNLDYYQAVRKHTLSIESRTNNLRNYYQKLQNLYPKSVFPDVYFVIGAKNTGGTTFKKGLIIGAEMFGKETETFKPRIDFDFIDQVVIHELIHFQQHYTADNSLLAQSIKEGTADFICELVTGSHSNQKIHEFANQKEKELWQEFSAKMYSNDWTPWLYYSKDKSRPQDLGYWMGYKIVKSYYDNSIDKSKAIDEILNIKNFKDFFEKSNYKPN